MKLHWFVFLTLIGMCLAVGAAFLAPQEMAVGSNGDEQTIRTTGAVHDRFETMRQGSLDAQRRSGTLWIGWVFVVLQVLFFGGCLAMGMERRRDGTASLGPAKQPLILATLVLAAIFTAVVFSYQRYAGQEAPPPAVPGLPRAHGLGLLRDLALPRVPHVRVHADLRQLVLHRGGRASRGGTRRGTAAEGAR